MSAVAGAAPTCAVAGRGVAVCARWHEDEQSLGSGRQQTTTGF